MENDTVKVFVYGTLKVGGHFAKSFDGMRKFSTRASVDASLFDLGAFPCVVLNTGFKVHGELHEYNHIKEVIKQMDMIEGYHEGSNHNLFNKKEVEVTTISGDIEKAIIYEIANTKAILNSVKNGKYKEIENGKWHN